MALSDEDLGRLVRAALAQVDKPVDRAPAKTSSKKPKQKRKPSKYQQTWAKEMKKIQAEKRLKNGNWRKGWDGKKAMAEAHKRTKRVMK